MDDGAPEAPLRERSAAAERMRQYRERHRKGLRCVRIQLDATVARKTKRHDDWTRRSSHTIRMGLALPVTPSM